jgi:hypothetical protein
MSRKNLFLLIAFLLVVVVAVFFFLYKKNSEPIPVPTQETNPLENDKVYQDLIDTKPVSTPKKSPDKIKTELQSAAPIKPTTDLSKDEVYQSLIGSDIKVNQ